MARYEVELTETIYHDSISVEADSTEGAEAKARAAWENGEMTTGESDLRFSTEELQFKGVVAIVA